jgi:hypothetical protein
MDPMGLWGAMIVWRMPPTGLEDVERDPELCDRRGYCPRLDAVEPRMFGTRLGSVFFSDGRLV